MARAPIEIEEGQDSHVVKVANQEVIMRIFYLLLPLTNY